MKKLDKEEQIIHDEFSKITTDTSELSEKVKRGLNDKIYKSKSSHSLPWTKRSILAIVLSTMLILTVAGGTLGGFDWFKENINPLFGDFVQPVEQFSDDQGIRMEVLGAEKYNDTAIIYLSLQDVSGENRLSQDATLLDSINIGMKSRLMRFSGQSAEVSGFSWRERFLSFDQETNTVYFEFIINTDADTKLKSPLQISSSFLYLDKDSRLDGNWEIVAKLDNKPENMITIKDNVFINGYTMEDITLSPLGINVKGTFEEEAVWDFLSEMNAAVETDTRIIPLENSARNQDNLNYDFRSSWQARIPLDLDKITAIIIGDVKIPISEGQ